MGDIVGYRVSPRRQPTVSPEEVTVAGLELDAVAFSDGLPLDRGIEAPGKGLDDFPAGHSEKEGLVRGGEVLAVAALEADDGFGSGYELDGPSGGFGGSVSVLGHRLFVFLG